MYHRNVKSERILCKFCALDSGVFCEINAKYRYKILAHSRVINLLIKTIKYACPLNKTDLGSLDFTVDRVFMKLFRTGNRNCSGMSGLLWF